MTSTKSQIAAQKKLRRILEDSVLRVAEGEPLQAFCEWFDEHAKATLAKLLAPDATDPDRPRRLMFSMARGLWSQVPVPGLRWRTQTLPKPDRNAPCYCGSGRKFKQCCTDLADLCVPISSDEALAVLLTRMAPQWLGREQLLRIAPAALAQAAMTIAQRYGQARVANLLAPLFLEAAGLDARHDAIFELLMEALLDLGQEIRREKLVRIVGDCTDKSLATSARCRHVSMLADRGEFDAAWALFGDTQRLNPNDPQLLHLELITLLAQGRADEAALRAPLLAAKARKLGQPDLAPVLLSLGQDGLRDFHEQQASKLDLDEEDQAWLALLRARPHTVQPEQVRSLHEVNSLPPMAGDDQPVLELKPVKALRQIELRWRKRFPLEPPMLTMLDGEADSILDEPDEAREFLARNPQGWLSVNLLDDLLMAAREMQEMSDAGPLPAAARALAAHAVEVCRALAPAEPCRVLWAMPDSRPFLRVLAQAIEFARQAGDAELAETLMRWSLALNPNDNHGWRDLLVLRCLATERAEEALSWLDRYPDDMPPAGHNRALALFMSGDKAQAESTMRAVHAEAPGMTHALLADLLDQPPAEGGPGLVIGGEMAAFYFRGELRPTWVRSGALAWLRALELPAPARQRAPRAKTVSKRKKGSSAPNAKAGGPKAWSLSAEAAFTASDIKALKARFPDYERLHGYIAAIAWSPGLVMPNAWLPGVMAMPGLAFAEGDKPPSLDQMNALLSRLMKLYNHLNGLVLASSAEGEPPLEGLNSGATADEAWLRWAAGFVQGAEQGAGHWRGAGLAVRSDRMPFKALHALASRAAGAPQGWRPTDDAGQALLTGVELNAEPVQVTLAGAMRSIWRVIAPIRQRRVAGIQRP